MAEVTFYVLASSHQQGRLEFACKLIEKIYRTGQSCYVLVDSDAQAQQLDNQLWTFRPGSFIPHQLYTGSVPDLPQTILIGGGNVPEAWQQVIVNLSGQYPTAMEKTERILEILDGSEETRKLGRARYRHYQSLSWGIVTHQV
jgi:DNA polymerase-3 subunit chi